MPGYLLDQSATVICAHGGQAQPTAPSQRVLVNGMPVVTQAAPWTVAGCSFVPPSGNGPCATAQFVTAATRILVNGTPVLLMDSQATCTPTGTPLTIVSAQTRVKGT
jgi:hypothetical protein